MLFLTLAVACTPEATSPPALPPTPIAAPVPAVAAPADPLATMRANPLRITRHGECRMACREFDREEVQAFLEGAEWNPDRTRNDGACPSHALEGTTRDGQNARMVFAACDRVTKLVTAIDLDTEHHCDCD